MMFFALRKMMLLAHPNALHFGTVLRTKKLKTCHRQLFLSLFAFRMVRILRLHKKKSTPLIMLLLNYVKDSTRLQHQLNFASKLLISLCCGTALACSLHPPPAAVATRAPSVRVRIPRLGIKKRALMCSFFMAAGEGFEPSQTESESVVLPLHNPAM